MFAPGVGRSLDLAEDLDNRSPITVRGQSWGYRLPLKIDWNGSEPSKVYSDIITGSSGFDVCTMSLEYILVKRASLLNIFY